MTYELHRNNKSLGMVESSLTRAIRDCQMFLLVNYEGRALSYSAIELAEGQPTNPGNRAHPSRVVAHRESRT